MKVGIIGSSYSVGLHHNEKTGENNLALPFETWLEKYTDNMQFFNSACAGKGTELYLNKVVYLKDRHNIDTLLIEIISNRSMLNFKCLPESYETIVSETNINKIENDVYQDSESSWHYWRALIQDMKEVSFSPSSAAFETWKKVQWNIAATKNAMEFWGMLDIHQTIKLCKMLDIKCVLWSKSWDFSKLPSFESMLQDSKFVKFKEYNCAHDYYLNKYKSLENILCDHDHFNDAVNEEMVRDFISPMLNELLDS